MNQQILDALETVIAWGLPDEDLSDALNDQARLMAGDDPEKAGNAHRNIPSRNTAAPPPPPSEFHQSVYKSICITAEDGACPEETR